MALYEKIELNVGGEKVRPSIAKNGEDRMLGSRFGRLSLESRWIRGQRRLYPRFIHHPNLDATILHLHSFVLKRLASQIQDLPCDKRTDT